ncbi:hypothetical protein JCGZ_19950 [Jatropha curcas]|uniref:Uncharacterized protein n=1 Tax=Jatropha curcas TaxID=180498 RepID=A0A067JTI3_JATCU|nr:malonyl-CoA:anthocyanidin 5-O-glucoside-6''-O-malonyltransferase [Jatropha curcas]KDP27251.1 hypothetical protein JCGZ_19950 [Jatropha curcas]
MAKVNPVKILEVCRVTPSSDSSKHAIESSLSLTHFEFFWLRFYPVEQIYFYELTDSTSSFFSSVILPKLKSSLSLALLHFLPVAGNITWPSNATKPVVLYTPNDGVSVTVAESNADFSYLSGNHMNEAIDSHQYVPELAISDSKAAILALQITLFPNQGFSIGVASHHGFLDGKSIVMFIRAWAHICKQIETEKIPTLSPELTPCFDRTDFQDPEGLDMVYLNNWLEAKLPGFNDTPKSLKLLPADNSLSNLARATFDLSPEDIKKLRQKLLSQLDDPNQTKTMHLSTFVLSYAYTLVCIAKARMFEGKRKIIIAFAADWRDRLDPPLPKNYIGCCVTTNPIFTEAETLIDENGFSFVAMKLSDMIKGLEKGILAGEKEKLGLVLKSIEVGHEDVIAVSASPKFEVYETDFGWGRPKKVDFTSIDWNGGISLLKSKGSNGGVEVGIVLEKREMEIFNSLFVNGLIDMSN